MIRDWIDAARPKTLPAAIVPILVGAAEAFRVGRFEWWPVVVCLAFALMVQIGTNMANDYYDFVKGADTKDRVGPERLVASGRIKAGRMLQVSLLVFAGAFLLGLSLVSYRGWELLVVGVVSIAFGFCYTGGPFPLAYRGLGDVFVIVFFGLVATAGTYYVLTGDIGLRVFLLGASLGLLANNILVVNNYRDRETDRAANKMTLVARWGAQFGLAQYRIQYLGAFLILACFVGSTGEWRHALPFASFPLVYRLSGQLDKKTGAALNEILAKTAAFLLLYGLLLTGGLLWSVS